MKKAIGLIMAVIMAATLAACSGAPETKSMFVTVEKADLWAVVYHRDTKVMYAMSFGLYNQGTMTLLVNADGTPMIYKGGNYQ